MEPPTISATNGPPTRRWQAKSIGAEELSLNLGDVKVQAAAA